jgi:hypothetical protein
MNTPQLILPTHRFSEDFERFERTQEITDDFLTKCSDNRIASMHDPMGEFHQCASIPAAVVDKWAREGFDIFQESLPKIMAKLRQEDLGAFITTSRQV